MGSNFVIHEYFFLRIGGLRLLLKLKKFKCCTNTYLDDYEVMSRCKTQELPKRKYTQV